MLEESPCRSAKPYTSYNINDSKIYTKGLVNLEYLITMDFAKKEQNIVKMIMTTMVCLLKFLN